MAVSENPLIDAVVIGRNEGARLEACLASLTGQVRRVVYVDSGSTDGSVPHARSIGARVIDLDLSRPFTAARARNAGLAALADDPPEFVQLIDGDCALASGWIDGAIQSFREHPKAVVVCGRRKERFPERSLYNFLADIEWDTPIGLALACGGDALMRYDRIMAVGAYREDLIAGEEPELCVRLRRAGGEVWRIDAPMTLHDAAITRFGQWWRRMVRSGYAFAEGAHLHGALPERHWVKERNRAVFWGLALPLIIGLAGLIHPVGLALAMIYPLQFLRLGWRERHSAKSSQIAVFSVIGKFAEARGIMGFWRDLMTGKKRGLIEYK